MSAIPPLSSKLAVTAGQGYFLRLSTQPKYEFGWHMHDCAMLLWPQVGALDSRWQMASDAPSQSRQLVRNTALLLPAAAPHTTRSAVNRQRHGELYLRPELLGIQRRYGVLQLDSAAVAILDALAAPTLAHEASEPLIYALMTQLGSHRQEQWLPSNELATSESISQRMLRCYDRALTSELTMPTVEAVAVELGISIRRLQRACAIELGTSPVALRRSLLAKKARELLNQGMLPSNVSQALGFTHSGHLNRLLRDVPH